MMKNKKIENIIETAIINNKTDFKYDVWVNGGKYYYINETSEPHFYFSEDIYNKKYTIISIPYNWNNKTLDIISNNLIDTEKELLIEWLDEQNYMDKYRTNLQIIILMWNLLNKQIL